MGEAGHHRGSTAPPDAWNVYVIPVNLNERRVLFIVGQSDGASPPLDRSSLGSLAKLAATALGLVALHRRLLSL